MPVVLASQAGCWQLKKIRMKRTIAFKTLGCRLNLYETDSVMSQFSEAGYEVVPFDRPADAYVVNTCTVTGLGDHKSRQSIQQAVRKNPEAVVVVTGCMVSHPKQRFEPDSHITYVVENERKASIFHLIDSHFNGEVVHPEDLEQNRFGYAPARDSFHTRSLVKIQDGCDNFCTFCIVPHVRGRAVSRPWTDIEKNIRELIGFGYRELVLTGVNIGRYRSEGLDFESLVEKILNIDLDFRLRISSIEPEGFGEKLFSLFEHPKLMPHLHMCLQSGSDKILLAMRRQYTVGSFMQMVESVRSRIPDFNFTTDIIVGFPGETEEDFQATLDVARKIGFGHIHTFKYSIREGTRAARLPGQVPEIVKKERSAAVRELAEELKREYRSSFIGKTEEVLVERIEPDGTATGYGRYYIPVKFRQEGVSRNDVAGVEITGIEEGEDPALIAR